ncbi:MAG: flagellar motor switch protein FliN/FliY [Alphaproteobacteria bacterium]|jgi:flagellar motor switch protein FliN/FliY
MDDTENIDFEDLDKVASDAPGSEEMLADDIDAAFEPVAASPSDQMEVGASVAGLEAVYDIPVQISAVLGKSTMQVSQLLKLGRGAVVVLDRKVGEAIDIYVNNRLVARGEVVVVNERLGVTMTEIIKSD